MAAPTTQTTSFVFSNVTANALTADWTRGDGEFVAVFATAAPTGDLSDGISDGDTYTGNAKFAAGTSPLGYDEWYCLYNGSGTSVNVTDLSPGVAYTFQAFEYNGPNGEEEYLVGMVRDNPASVTTIVPSQMIRLRRRRTRRAR